ncbi:hypothetical protein HPT25_03635 [Bacillus sp. BRMEA1]|uniref:hypothetical protein n=1 Tax=Neobacillus endophyticus TaxID=2738405 RepID=UPI0015632C91|nr:hypothetical protein [Neobacillus endophyticus]NRD76582.1 hypothetical protein [Neobacillus endophyticus]
MRDSEPYVIGYAEGFEKGFIKAVELVNAVSLDEEQRMLLARGSLDYLPFPKIMELFRLSVSQGAEILNQEEFEEYVKDEFDLYVENDGFFSKEEMDGIYQYRLKLSKRYIEDTPAQEIISLNKILSKDLKKLLMEYIEGQEKADSKERGKGEKE